MADPVALGNAALSYCGTRSKIASLTEGSTESAAIQTHIDLARQQSLRAYDWNFARRTVALAPVSLPIPSGQTVAPTSIVARWRHEYAMPTDCLKVRRINDTVVPLNPVDWFELATDLDNTGNPINVLFTNDPAAVLIYTMDVRDPNRWDVSFVNAVEFLLAHKICFELTGKSDRAKELFQEWQDALWRAAAESANETPSQQPTWRTDGMQARGYMDGLEHGNTERPFLPGVP